VQPLERSLNLKLTFVAAIKTNIFRQLNWSIRRPTEKQSKQLAREKRQYAQKNRSMEADPRKEKEEQIMRHTGWTFKKSDLKRDADSRK
jgi:large subunit ribosomal protein L32